MFVMVFGYHSNFCYGFYCFCQQGHHWFRDVICHFAIGLLWYCEVVVTVCSCGGPIGRKSRAVFLLPVRPCLCGSFQLRLSAQTRSTTKGILMWWSFESWFIFFWHPKIFFVMFFRSLQIGRELHWGPAVSRAVFSNRVLRTRPTSQKEGSSTLIWCRTRSHRSLMTSYLP